MSNNTTVTFSATTILSKSSGSVIRFVRKLNPRKEALNLSPFYFLFTKVDGDGGLAKM